MQAFPMRLRWVAGAMVCGMLAAGVTRFIDDDHFAGTLTTVGPSEVMVSVGDETMTFNVSGTTMISVNGDPARLAELKTGDSVRIMAHQRGEDGVRTAIRIDAERDTNLSVSR